MGMTLLALAYAGLAAAALAQGGQIPVSSPDAPPRVGSSSSPGPARTQLPGGYTRHPDPIEHAFTVEAPSGWRAEVGMARSGLIQVNPYVRTLSPDKMTYIMLGEPDMTSYAPPNPNLPPQVARQYREGTIYSPGLGQRIMIMHYIPGAEYARAYGQTVLGNVCSGLKFISIQNRPDVASRVQAEQPSVIPSRYDAGDAIFSCTHNKKEMEGRVEVATTTTLDGAQWGVLRISAFIAPKAQGDAVQAMVTRMIASFQFLPAWIQQQNELTRLAGIAIQERIRQQERQQAAFMEKFNSVDRNFVEFDEMINGNSHYVDPHTGQQYLLNNENPYKWVNDYGRIVGTKTSERPPFGNWSRMDNPNLPGQR
jgi:hypothetical protein